MTDTEPTPFARATIRRGRLTLNPWTPWLICNGPARAPLAAATRRGSAFADLTIIEGDELIVAWVPEESGSEEAKLLLTEWACPAGYYRLWFPDEVVDLEPEPVSGTAEVTCPTCRARWSDSGSEFWELVHNSGHFPPTCAACGGSLPEWTVEPNAPSRPPMRPLNEKARRA